MTTAIRATRPLPATRRRHHPVTQTRVETPRVLLIEDHPSLREALAHSLEENGCQVIRAGGGVQGFLEFLRREPDLVVLDVQLPDMDGVRLLGEIRQRSPEVPVMIMTSQMAPVFSTVPSVTVLRKPFLPRQFMTEVGRALGEPRWLMDWRPE